MWDMLVVSHQGHLNAVTATAVYEVVARAEAT